MAIKAHSIFDPAIILPAIGEAFRKLNPVTLARNPVMFVTEVGAAISTILLVTGHGANFGFQLQIALWLWFIVLVANFAEAMAEGRGKAQAKALRGTQTQTFGKRLKLDGTIEKVPAQQLRKDDVVVVSAGELIPGDGEVIEGAATVDESAITGESAPVIRESGSDRSAVTGGTKVLSDQIKVQITSKPGETFVDRMISLVEGVKRQKTPNEIALTILLSALTLIFLIAVMSLKAFGIASSLNLTIPVLVALLVCLIPTTMGGLLNAIGIAGIDRLVRKNVLASNGRAVEAAGDIDVLLLDKTGTVTMGDRQATNFLPVPGVTKEQLADAAQLASLADETPEGRSVVILAKKFGIRARQLSGMPNVTFVPFTAQTRMSGVDLDGVSYRKGAAAAIRAYVGRRMPDSVEKDVAGANGYLQKSYDLLTSFKDVLGKRVREVPGNYESGELVRDTAMDLETNVSTEFTTENSLLLQEGPVSKSAVIKIAQTFRTGTNDIDALDYVFMYLNDEKQSYSELHHFNGVYVLDNFRPVVTNKNWRIDCGVAGYDNRLGLPPFFPTRLRFEDYIYRLWIQQDGVVSAHTDAVQTHIKNNYMRNPLAMDVFNEEICTLLKKKIKGSLVSVDDLSIRFSYQGEVSLQDSEEILEKITTVHNRILKAASSTKNEARKRALILFAENLARSFYGFEPDFFQQNVSRIVDDVVSQIQASLEIWPTLIEICYFHKDKREFPQTRIDNKKVKARIGNGSRSS